MHAPRLAVVALLLLPPPPTPPISRGALPEVDPASVGLDPARLARIERVVDRAIEKKQVPGGVSRVGGRGKGRYARAFGGRPVPPEAEPMTRDTVFDMASLTKPMATAT